MFCQCRYSIYLSIYLWLYSLCGLRSLFQFLNLHTVGRTPWTGDQLSAHRTTQTQNKGTQISVPRMGFEPTIPAFERTKAVHVIDRAATVIYNGDIQIRISQRDYICIVTVLGAELNGESAFDSRRRQRIFSSLLLPEVLDPASYPRGNRGFFSMDLSGRGVKLTIHFHLLSKLGIHGAIHQRSPYVLMESCLIQLRDIVPLIWPCINI
jgi:hypothetical protein